MLTRKAMEQAISIGGSIAYKGRIIARVADLPTAAELAQGDPVAEAQAAQDVQQQIAALQAQLDALQAERTDGSDAKLSSDQPPIITPKK